MVNAQGVSTVSYLIAAVLFILSLGGLSQHETARRGNRLGIAGMLLALVVTLWLGLAGDYSGLGAISAALLCGALLGLLLAMRVAMTAMPQLVAVLHSFVGLAAVLVGFASFMSHISVGHASGSETEAFIAEIESILGIFIGAVTFSGSVIAFGKLQGIIGSKPWLLPGRHVVNSVMVIGSLLLASRVVGVPRDAALAPLVTIAVIAAVLGVHLVMAIGGADMPVVVSMLNSYSGWAAAATGFLLANDLLIVTGALVGASGAILSYIMCRAMNRSFLSVILGGFGEGTGVSSSAAAAAGAGAECVAVSAADVAGLFSESRAVIVVPGYGMAVAQAQHAMREISQLLIQRGVKVRFAIHPVAGRLPGHMNVLLAEANVPYDLVLEMDEINADFATTDVVFVVGANDIVNPGALDDPSSPIYGMPVLHAWEAGTVVVSKRGMATGYSGVDNPLFYRPNTRMLFGDAKSSVEAVLAVLKAND